MSETDLVCGLDVVDLCGVNDDAVVDLQVSLGSGFPVGLPSAHARKRAWPDLPGRQVRTSNAGERKEVDEAEARREEMQEGRAFGGNGRARCDASILFGQFLPEHRQSAQEQIQKLQWAAGRSALQERRLDSMGIDRQEGISRLPAE